jgi:hypothetical protein
VKHALATQASAVEKPAGAQSQSSGQTLMVETVPVQSAVSVMRADAAKASPLENPPLREPKKTWPTPKKPLFWSATMQTQGNASRANGAAASTSVPPVLRNLQQCQACGFPVSQGRTFCVECEERQWRGQRLSQPAAGSPAPQNAPKKVISAPIKAASAATSSAASSPDILTLSNAGLPADLSGSHTYAPFSGSTVESRSWFARNKYVLGALLVVAIVVAAIVWLR